MEAFLSVVPEQYHHLALLVMAAVIFHAILWARNAHFLWSHRRTIFFVILLAEVWMLITDPIGGWWRAWFFDPNKVLGIWLFTYMPIEDLFGVAVISSAAACAILVFGYSPRKWI